MHSDKSLVQVEAAQAQRSSSDANGAPANLHAGLPPLKLVTRPHANVPVFEHAIRQKAAQNPVRILEAGCGNKWPLDLTGLSYRLTGVDVDKHALEIRKTKVRDLDEIMVGDLRTAGLFPEATFDVIYSSFVLEHVDGAERVLDNFFRWLAPGGLLIVRIPDRDSVYGFITRITPFWAHVLYKRHVQGVRNAGTPGFDPYPTYYDDVVSRVGLHRYCGKHGWTIKYESGFAGYLPTRVLVGLLVRSFVRVVAAVSLGRLEWRYNNITLVIEKPN